MVFWGVSPRTRIVLAFLFLDLSSGYAQSSPLVDLLAAELNRNFTGLKQADPPPYFMAYGLVDDESESVSASFGSLQNSSSNKSRTLDVTLRVGSPQFDNYHRMRGDFPHFTSGASVPWEDSPNAIRRRAWFETDRIYRLATQRFIRLKTNQQVKAAEEDTSDDFSAESPVVHIDSPIKFSFNRTDWVNRLRKISNECNKRRGILACNITVAVDRQTKYLVNSEGTRLQQSRGFARILMSVQGKAGDGMDLAATDSFEAETPDRLPKDDVILASMVKITTRLETLLKAPPVDPFVGPAILSGSAAGVFFHEIFGHRIEGHRQKDESEGQTFTKSVGKPVLPTFLSVLSDPTKKVVGKTDLNGWYQFDDEGVQAAPVKVVDNGILRTFLMSRSPIRGFSKSNGHGRRQAGAEVVSRQSNLIVESTQAVALDELRTMLIEEVKKQGKPYGLLFDQVTGGYTTTGRQGLQAFTVMPLVVYRVYADGRPDELVRGVNIVGTPLASFAKITATSNTPEVFNGICGAESGSVPVSAISPALLVSEIEVQRKPVGMDSPPTLPRPVPIEGAN